MNRTVKTGPIAEEWQTLDSERSSSLDQVRQIAALTEPAVLPKRNQLPDQDLPNPYQSLGPRGAVNLSGVLLTYLFSAEYPWAKYTLAPEYLYSSADPVAIQNAQDMLLLADLTTHALFETASREYRRPLGFRSQKHRILMQLLVGGDVLEVIEHGENENGDEGDEFRIKFFRQDRYVTQRDSGGAPLLHITSESKDVATLSDADFEKSKIEKDLRKGKRSERFFPLHTRVEWQPWTRKWNIQQEINGEVIREYDDEYSRYICTPYRLVGEEHYGRGFFAAFEGDLRSLEKLRETLLDFAAAAAKHLLMLDQSSELRAEDFARRSGSVIEGARIVNGIVQDAAFFKADKLQDFSVVRDVHDSIHQDVGSAVMLRSEAVRQSERTTAYEVAETVIREMEGMQGGIMAQVADYQQVPLFNYARYWLQKKNKLPKQVGQMFERKMVNVEAVTGIAALAKVARANSLLTMLERVGRIDPTMLAPLDKEEVLRYLGRAANFYEPGLIKSRAKLEQEKQEALQFQAAQQGIETTGKVVENAAAAQAASAASAA